MTTKCPKCNRWIDVRGHPCPFDFMLDPEEQRELEAMREERSAGGFDDE